MTSYTNVFGGQVINPTQVSYIAISLTSNTTLSWGTEFQNTNPVVAYQMDVSPDMGGRTLTLPDATQTSVGQAILVNNPTAFSFSLNKADNTLLATISGPSINYFYLTNNSTTGGTWRQTPFGGGYTAVTSIAAVPASAMSNPSINNLSITGSPITTTGTFTFAFIGDLLKLISFGGTTGIATRIGTEDWALRTITGGPGQIQITNGNGVVGNPLISLASNITGVTSITSGNIKISTNLIEAINANGGIELKALGTGNITLNPSGTGQILANKEIVTGFGTGVTYSTADSSTGYFRLAAANMGTTQVSLAWPTSAPSAGQVIRASATPTQLEWATVPTLPGVTTTNAIAKYISIGGTLGEAGVLIDNSNNMSGITSAICGNIAIAAATSNTISSNNTNGNIIFSPNGSGRVQTNCSIDVRTANQINFYNTANSFFNFLTAVPGLAATVGWTLPSADGAANTIMQTSGAGALSFTSSSITTTKIPKVWIEFDTSGTSLAAEGATVARDSAGVYTVTFTTAFATTSYSVEATIYNATGFVIYDNKATGSVKIRTFNTDGTTASDRQVSVTICGNQ